MYQANLVESFENVSAFIMGCIQFRSAVLLIILQDMFYKQACINMGMREQSSQAAFSEAIFCRQFFLNGSL